MMTNNRARIVGALFLLALVTSILGGSIIEINISEPNDLTTLYTHKTAMLIGMLLELTCAVSVIFIGIIMYPIFKKSHGTLAIGYVSFRIMEAMTIVIALISPLLVLKLSELSLVSNTIDMSTLQHLSTLFIEVRDDVLGLILVSFFSVNAIIFYYVMYHIKLIPRFISIWGIIGAILVFAMNLSGLFGLKVYIIMALPIITNELFLSFWLMIKGFKVNQTR